MATNEGPGPDYTGEAAADLSALQYTAVKLSSGVAAASSQGELTIGILQDAPAAAGDAARVRYAGRSKALLGGTVVEMDELTTGSAGKLEAAASGDYVLCIALQAGDANDIIDVLFISSHKLA